MSRPNLLYLFTDQQSHDAMSCAHNADLHTPHMDALAARGVRFTQAHCAFPLCTPSRAAMISGQHPAALGVTANTIDWTDAQRIQTLGHLFRNAGYRTAWGGKWHIGPGGISYPDPDKDPDFAFEPICPFNDQQLPKAAADFITDAPKHNQPWLLVASFDNPHNICEHGRNQPLPWGEVEISPNPADWPSLPANYPPAPEEPQAITRFRDHNPRTQHAAAYTPDRWRRYRAVYYRLVEKVDAQLGQVLATLDASGQTDNTVIVFASDHGDATAAHQLAQKWTLYDESVRVPFIIADPTHTTRAAQTEATLINAGLDLLPTLCGLAGITAPPGLPGRDLTPLLHQPGAALNHPRDHLILETQLQLGDGLASAGRAVVTNDHKYTLYDFGQHAEQLTNRHADPGEMVNLATRSQHRHTLLKHRTLLFEHLRDHKDPFGINPTYGPNTVALADWGHVDLTQPPPTDYHSTG
ncbi:MAG: sulfatase-like hydrolase/transferase [Planctomycetota bacterium]